MDLNRGGANKPHAVLTIVEVEKEYIHRLSNAAQAAKNIDSTNCTAIPESQLRPLTKAPPEDKHKQTPCEVKENIRFEKYHAECKPM